MDEKMRLEMGEVAGIIGNTWKGCAISAGVTAGFFNKLSRDESITSEKLASSLNFDQEKVEKWIYFALLNGIVEKKNDGYILTSIGGYFAPESPAKDLYGFVQLTSYYLNAAMNAKETFKKNLSLEALTEGKVSRDYQPKVSDNLSASLLEHLKNNNVKDGDTLLDIGSGNGSFLRSLHEAMPNMELTGLDTNLFSIELGRKEIARLEISDKVKLLVGDAMSDLDDYADGSYEWVTCINVFHFYPVEKRQKLIDDLIRVAKKGVFFTEGIIEKAPMMSSANILMGLLWNDFTGFFKQQETDEIDDVLSKKYDHYKVEKNLIVQGVAYLVAIIK
ncbi:MAG: methyltransferase domain-containing protein [Brevinematales bacterium]|nr:methyltransferase domain-containing protein [Brevinematales bacterium]